jgi:tripartite-type tricarboxylate transporter receptor subunit TctC
MVIAVNPALPVKSIAELVAYAKARPGVVPIGTTSKSAAQLTMQSLAHESGAEFLHVFYKSAPDALRDMVSEQVMVFSDALAAVPNLNDPRIRVLAVTAPQRLPNLPDLPVVAEAIPGFTSYGWYAIMAPAGTSRDVVKKMNEDVNAVLSEPDMVARLRDLATYDVGGTPEQLDRFIRSERERLGKAARAAKIELE